jgi:hypothetical protein
MVSQPSGVQTGTHDDDGGIELQELPIKNTTAIQRDFKAVNEVQHATSLQSAAIDRPHNGSPMLAASVPSYRSQSSIQVQERRLETPRPARNASVKIQIPKVDATRPKASAAHASPIHSGPRQDQRVKTPTDTLVNLPRQVPVPLVNGIVEAKPSRPLIPQAQGYRSIDRDESASTVDSLRPVSASEILDEPSRRPQTKPAKRDIVKEFSRALRDSPKDAIVKSSEPSQKRWTRIFRYLNCTLC